MMFEVVLDWPSNKLAPNFKLHHLAKAPIARRAKSDSFYLCRCAGFRAGMLPYKTQIEVWVYFYQPDKRYRDKDNMIGQIKWHLDGVAKALDIDDFYFNPHFFYPKKTIKLGRVVVRISRTEPLEKEIVDTEI